MVVHVNHEEVKFKSSQPVKVEERDFKAKGQSQLEAFNQKLFIT